MLIPSITATYASVLGLGYVYLSARVGLLRWQLDSYYGERDVTLRRLVRVHANFAEYVPFALLLIAFAELFGTPAYLLHPLGVSLVVARVLHAVGVAREPEPIWWRIMGFTITLAVIAAASCASLYFVIRP